MIGLEQQIASLEHERAILLTQAPGKFGGERERINFRLGILKRDLARLKEAANDRRVSASLYTAMREVLTPEQCEEVNERAIAIRMGK